jgi:hypothetical protein
VSSRVVDKKCINHCIEIFRKKIHTLADVDILLPSRIFLKKKESISTAE